MNVVVIKIYHIFLYLMNIFRNKNLIKNKLKEEYDIPTNIEALNKWTIPKIEPSLIYKLGTFEKMGLKQVVKTTKETIPLNSEELTIRLVDESDLLAYKYSHKYMHIRLVQIAFKPLNLEGLPESFIMAALRDGRNLNWKQSLTGIVQTSLAHGPIYFDVYPNLQLSLSDINLLDSLTLNVKTDGYNYKFGTKTTEGSVNLEFDNISRPSTSSRLSSKLSKSSSMRNYISPFDYKIERPLESSRASTSQIKDAERIERLIIDHNNIVSGINTKDPE
ncbi:hypothetical protein QQ045_005740 [Rhodiola kirilowii]